MFQVFLDQAELVEMYANDYDVWLDSLSPDELEILNERNSVIEV